MGTAEKVYLFLFCRIQLFFVMPFYSVMRLNYHALRKNRQKVGLSRALRLFFRKSLFDGGIDGGACAEQRTGGVRTVVKRKRSEMPL